MKRILKFLAHLYPTSWRRRYGDEYEALLEEAKPRVRDVFDVFWGAFKMQMETWRLARITIVCSLAGMLAAVAISFTRSPLYLSQSLISVDTSDPQAMRNVVFERAKDLWAQPFLVEVIQKENLYASERAQMPLNDVVGLMKKNIVILLVRRKDGKLGSAYALDFTYPDPHVAQRVDEELTSRFMALNVNAAIKSLSAGSRPPEIYAVENSAGLPQRSSYPRRNEFGALGLLAGLVGGLVVAAIAGWRRRLAVAAD
jgi:hypothetical protein